MYVNPAESTMISSQTKEFLDETEFNIYIVKMGKTKRDFLRLKKSWEEEGIAGFSLPQIGVDDPQEDNKLCKRRISYKGTSLDSQVHKLAQYMRAFLHACPERDWLLAYYKGFLIGFGLISKDYPLTNKRESTWQYAIGVNWVWLNEPIRLHEYSKALYHEARHKFTVRLVCNPIAIRDFLKLIRDYTPEDSFYEMELYPEDYLGDYRLEQLAEETYVPIDLLREIEHSLTECKKYQIILDGVAGTGKTFIAQKLAKYLTHKEGKHIGEYKLISCHSGMTFEYLFQGLVPTHSGGLKAEKGIIAKFSEQARDNDEAYYVLILDEINRANIPQVFGQFLYLLEYRGKEIELPFNHELLSLPKNLLIIATMNSDDRSTGVLDFAFKRRFTHFKFAPNAEILKKWLHYRYGNNIDVDINRVLSIFNRLNEKILNFDSHFQVGHVYFMTEYPLNESNLQRLWRNDLLPLLEEKFFHNKSLVRDHFSLEFLL